MNLRLYIPIFFLSILLFLSSCRDEKQLTYRISGVITNSQSGAPVSNVDIELQGKALTGGTFNSNFQFVTRTQTDNTGNYELIFDRELFSELEIEGSRTDYIGFKEILEVNEEELLDGKTYGNQVSPISTIELRARNISPLNDDDRLVMTYFNSQVDNCECCPSTQTFIGMDVDTVVSCITIGDRELEYIYTVVKSGSSLPVEETVYLEPFETTVIEINY